MENGHDSPYLRVNWVMRLANTNGRKTTGFLFETAPSGSSGQVGGCTLNSGGIWVLEPLGHCTIEKVITKTAACHHVSE